MRLLILAAALALAPISAWADDATLSIEQCIAINNGLTSLGHVGQQLGDFSAPPADAKQYKLGPTRMTIALDIAALIPVLTAAQKAQQQFIAELPPLPPAGEPNSTAQQARIDVISAQNKKATINQQAIFATPCPVKLGHLDLKDLKIGDGADENPIPPPVIAALIPIIDGLK